MIIILQGIARQRKSQDTLLSSSSLSSDRVPQTDLAAILRVCLVSEPLVERQRHVERIRKFEWRLRTINVASSLTSIWSCVQGGNEERIDNFSKIGAPPCAFVVKEPICALLELLCDCLWLFVTLKPSLILLMEAPALILQCLGREILLVSPLLVVEYVEKCVWIYTRV